VTGDVIAKLYGLTFEQTAHSFSGTISWWRSKIAGLCEAHWPHAISYLGGIAALGGCTLISSVKHGAEFVMMQVFSF